MSLYPSVWGVGIAGIILYVCVVVVCVLEFNLWHFGRVKLYVCCFAASVCNSEKRESQRRQETRIRAGAMMLLWYGYINTERRERMLSHVCMMVVLGFIKTLSGINELCTCYMCFRVQSRKFSYLEIYKR
jgi:hypothetical protein